MTRPSAARPSKKDCNLENGVTDVPRSACVPTVTVVPSAPAVALTVRHSYSKKRSSSPVNNASWVGLARKKQRAVLPDNAILRKNPHRACHDSTLPTAFSQEASFGLACAALVGNAIVSEEEAISSRDR
jgi:hypothetical protein